METKNVCGYCLRKVKKKLTDPPRKILARAPKPCDLCPTYYAKHVVKVSQ